LCSELEKIEIEDRFYKVFEEVEKRVEKWPEWQKELLSVPQKEDKKAAKQKSPSLIN